MIELPEITPLTKTIPLVNRFRFFNVKLTYPLLLRDAISVLNWYLESFRDDVSIPSSAWRISGIQDFIDDICVELRIPLVRIHSGELFYEEHFEAALKSWHMSPSQFYERIRLIAVAFSRLQTACKEYWTAW